MGCFDRILLASDLDGTLLDAGSAVSEKNRAALARFMSEGGRFAPATGRSKLAYEVIRGEIDCNAPCIFSNGAYIYDLGTGKELFCHSLRGAYTELLDDVLAWRPDVGHEIHYPEQIFVANRNGYIDRHLGHINVAGRDIGHYREAKAPWIKMMLVDDPALLQEAAAWLLPKYGREFAFIFSCPFMLEIQNAGVCKALGVKKLIQWLDIPHENVFVAGDAQNDLGMLREFTSFAPENAYDEAKAAADHIMPGNDDDMIAAVVAFIERRLSRER